MFSDKCVGQPEKHIYCCKASPNVVVRVLILSFDARVHEPFLPLVLHVLKRGKKESDPRIRLKQLPDGLNDLGIQLNTTIFGHISFLA